jgi:hypothetical protein
LQALRRALKQRRLRRDAKLPNILLALDSRVAISHTYFVCVLLMGVLFVHCFCCPCCCCRCCRCIADVVSIATFLLKGFSAVASPRVACDASVAFVIPLLVHATVPHMIGSIIIGGLLMHVAPL